MELFRNIKVRSKLMVLALILMAFMVVVAFIGYYYLTVTEADIADLYNNNLISV